MCVPSLHKERPVRTTRRQRGRMVRRNDLSAAGHPLHVHIICMCTSSACARRLHVRVVCTGASSARTRRLHGRILCRGASSAGVHQLSGCISCRSALPARVHPQQKARRVMERTVAWSTPPNGRVREQDRLPIGRAWSDVARRQRDCVIRWNSASSGSPSPLVGLHRPRDSIARGISSPSGSPPLRDLLVRKGA